MTVYPENVRAFINERRRLVASGRVRLMVLEPGAEAGGKPVALQSLGQ